MAQRPVTFVGFYGCANRVVRCATPTSNVGIHDSNQVAKKPQPRHRVDCPACGLAHTVKVAWRIPTDYDEGRNPELRLMRRAA